MPQTSYLTPIQPSSAPHSNNNPSNTNDNNFTTVTQIGNDNSIHSSQTHEAISNNRGLEAAGVINIGMKIHDHNHYNNNSSTASISNSEPGVTIIISKPIMLVGNSISSFGSDRSKFVNELQQDKNESIPTYQGEYKSALSAHTALSSSDTSKANSNFEKPYFINTATLGQQIEIRSDQILQIHRVILRSSAT